MSDGSYNGFYTDVVDSIKFDQENGSSVQKVFAKKRIYTIPVDKIDSVTIERARFSDGDVGDYRFCECDLQESAFRKIFIDNRAYAFASKTGEFFANDTILITSIYNDIRLLLITDNNGRVYKMTDGYFNSLIHYNEDDSFSIIDLISGEVTHAPYYRDDKVITRSTIMGAVKALKHFLIQTLPYFKKQAPYLCCDGIFYGLDNLEMIENNPELYKYKWKISTLDALLSAVDPLSYLASAIYAIFPNNGTEFLNEFMGISSSLEELHNEFCPDSETKNTYKQFYKNKYGILIDSLFVDNITANSALLKAKAFSREGFKNGPVMFCLKEIAGEYKSEVPAEIVELSPDNFVFSAEVDGLMPTEWFLCYVSYNCIIPDTIYGFDYLSEKNADFTTLTPVAQTHEVIDVKDCSVVVSCAFDNIPDGASYGVMLQDGTKYLTQSGNSLCNVNLTNLNPHTTYTCYAFIEYKGKIWKGDELSFTTESTYLNFRLTVLGDSEMFPSGRSISIGYELDDEGNILSTEGEDYISSKILEDYILPNGRRRVVEETRCIKSGSMASHDCTSEFTQEESVEFSVCYYYEVHEFGAYYDPISEMWLDNVVFYSKESYYVAEFIFPLADGVYTSCCDWVAVAGPGHGEFHESPTQFALQVQFMRIQ